MGAPLQKLTFAFDKRKDHEGNAGLRPTQRVQMETTGRLAIGSGKVRNPADAARLLSPYSTAAQENLFTIAVDMDPPIPNQ